MIATPDEVLDFWFKDLSPEQWFKADAALDAGIARRFSATFEALSRNVPDNWSAAARGALAGVVVLDQFPRNMFRGTPRAFATDAAALALSTEAIEQRFDRSLSTVERQFLYLPFEHAEDRDMQRRSVELFETLGDANVLDYAKKHRAIIDRFGRFPHRNAILGRESSADEIAFLMQPGSSF